MQQKTFLFLLLLGGFLFGYSQNTELINPKKNFYFGAGLGINEVTSNEFSKPKHLGFDLFAEYYFAKQWSVSLGLKYYKIQVAYESFPGLITNGAKPYQIMYFEGENLSFPLKIHWEFRVIKNFKGFLSLGTNLNFETQSNYLILHPNNPEQSKSFNTIAFGFNYGYGFTYFLNKKIAFYTTIESISGNKKGTNDKFLNIGTYIIRPRNLFNTIGVKYTF